MFTLAETIMPQIDQSLVDLARWIPALPALALLINGVVFAALKPLRKLSAAVTIAALAGSFVLSVLVMLGLGDISQLHGGITVHCFEWISIGDFTANFAFFIDPLTCVMLLVVTGVGTLIAIYASGYMAGDPGYYRFFAYIALFIVAMTLLVLGDNLLLLFLGWEGVGLSSYLLIGYYYRKLSARDAAKKAFIVNRVGDFGFALGLMGVFLVFGIIGYEGLMGHHGLADAEHIATLPAWKQNLVLWIPFLLMLGAFGKSAQLPLHVWLPDAMEGPTPVSALIHAATMVTAGVYMIARLLPIFQLSEYALPTVAIVGGVTAIFAATIALCQFDIKRIWAYSTVSQLGYMFLGVGVAATYGAVFHLFTHAFFKALLFLTAGSVMHALAGQLDLRRMSGLGKKMPITAGLMLIGCLALAGFPFTAGYFSKDEILYQAINSEFGWLGWIGVLTALLTAFYTFRLWFRVFMGETKYEMSNEHHGYAVDHPLDDHAHGPHEMSWLMNGPLVVLAVGALVFGVWLGGKEGWMMQMVEHSSAAVTSHASHDAGHGAAASHGDDHHGPGYVSHGMVGAISGGGAVVMIVLAGFFFWKRRDLAESIAAKLGPITKIFENKYYVDEAYRFAIVLPLRALGWFFYLFDRVIIDGVVLGSISWAPRIAGALQKPGQNGLLQGYALLMALGIIAVLAVVVYAVVL